MKKILSITLVSLSLVVGSLSASEESTDNGVAEYNYLRVYGVGLQIGTPNSDIKDKSYNGAGVEFENNFADVVVEYGSDYTKGSAVLKYDITNDFYIKGGLGYLKREMLILGYDKDVTQTNLGAGLGYGDEKIYNIEAGYLDSELKDTALADGHSKIAYIEVVGKHKFAKYATFDVVGIYKNTNVFDKNYDDYQAELGWFATDDVRTFAGYDSVKHDENDYAIRAGVQYAFGTSEFSPFLRATANADKNIAVGLEYSEGIANKSLKMRDFFESAVGTVDIVAQTVAPDVFASKVAGRSASSNSDTPTAVDVAFNMAGTEVQTFSLASSVTNAQTINVTVAPTHGTLSWSGSSFTYTATPGSGYVGADSFDYTVTNSKGVTTAPDNTVTINNILEDGT